MQETLLAIEEAAAKTGTGGGGEKLEDDDDDEEEETPVVAVRARHACFTLALASSEVASVLCLAWA
jgi:hypothetical protein